MRRERARTSPHTNSRYQPRADTTCKMGEELTKVRSLLLHGQGILLINLWMCGRPGFDPWVGKIPWWRVWQPTPVFLSGESPWTEKPGGLQSMELQRVRHNWVIKHTLWPKVIIGSLNSEQRNQRSADCWSFPPGKEEDISSKWSLNTQW